MKGKAAAAVARLVRAGARVVRKRPGLESTRLTHGASAGVFRYDPNSHPAVRATYAAHVAASAEADRLAAPDAEPGTPDAQAAHEAQYRLYLAHKAHHETWVAASNSREYWTNMDWLDMYPDLADEMHRDFVREVEADWEAGLL